MKFDLLTKEIIVRGIWRGLYIYIFFSGMIFAEMLDTDLFFIIFKILFLYLVQKSKTMSLLY